METLVALGEVLVEGRALSLEERRHLAADLEDRLSRDPEPVSLYRAAAATLDRLAGQRFAMLTVSVRMEIIARHRLAGSLREPGEHLAALPGDIRAIRMHVVPDLIRGYYRSSAGWAVVGYDQFPGRCGDLARYTRPEA